MDSQTDGIRRAVSIKDGLVIPLTSGKIYRVTIAEEDSGKFVYFRGDDGNECRLPFKNEFFRYG